MQDETEPYIIKEQTYQGGEASFEALFMNLPDPSFVVNRKYGIITLYNPAFKKIMKATNEQLAGLSQFDISPDFQEHVGMTSAEYGKEIIDNLKLGDSAFFEWTHKNIDGELFTVEVSVSYIKILDEEVYLSCWRDLSLFKEQEKQLKELQNISNTDYLTGICNRRHFDELIHLEVTRSNRYNTKLSLIMLDIDHFKQVNDLFGHSIGDRALIELVNIIKNQKRETDIFARWGGEEFCLLIPNIDSRKAECLAEKYRNMVENHTFPEVGKLTISLGVTEYLRGEPIDSMLKKADKALYYAKNSGRNSVVVCFDQFKSG